MKTDPSAAVKQEAQLQRGDRQRIMETSVWEIPPCTPLSYDCDICPSTHDAPTTRLCSLSGALQLETKLTTFVSSNSVIVLWSLLQIPRFPPSPAQLVNFIYSNSAFIEFSKNLGRYYLKHSYRLEKEADSEFSSHVKMECVRVGGEQAMYFVVDL